MRPQYSILLLMACAASVPSVGLGQIQSHQPAVPLTLVDAIDLRILPKPAHAKAPRAVKSKSPAKRKISATPVKQPVAEKKQALPQQPNSKNPSHESAPAVELNSPHQISPNTQKRVSQTVQSAVAPVEQIASLPTAPLAPLVRSPFPRTRVSNTYQRPATSQTELTQPFPVQSTQEFEFGTVMSFPARAEKPTPPAILTQDKDEPTTEPASKAKVEQISKPRFQNASAIVSPPNSIMIAPRVQSEVLATRVLAPSIIGPSSLTQNVPGDFQIVVANTSDQIVNDVIVQLSLPQEMIITKFYRQAWLNNETRSLSWRLDQIQPGQKETIRYSVRSTHSGQHQQTISLGMQNVNQGVVPFTTLVEPR